MKAKISRFRRVLIALFFVSWCMLPGPAQAADKYWVGGDAGYWDDSANWSLSDGGPGGAGQPQDGDNIYFIRSVTGGDATVQYRNTVNPNAQLGALYLYGFGPGLLTLEQSSGDTLKTSSEYIGMNGRGAYNQINGANLVSGELVLGYYSGSQGIYTLQGGSLSARTQTIGFLGSGAFTQTGGTNAVSGVLYPGNYSAAAALTISRAARCRLIGRSSVTAAPAPSPRAAADSQPIIRSSACMAAAPSPKRGHHYR